MGGFTLLKDSKDPLSVMLGTTNILTTLVLLWTSYHVGVYSMTNSVVEIPLLFGIAISMMAAGVLISEVLADGELAMVQNPETSEAVAVFFTSMALGSLVHAPFGNDTAT